jgi:cytochrome oxidase Cu insertion factor (SCO1/SenC/PrrC family)
MNRFTASALAAALLVAGTTALAHDGPHKPAPSAAPARSAQPATVPIPGQPEGGTRDARAYFTDLELQTQDGRKVRFYSDLLDGRTVVINVIYTSCKDACPLLTRQLLEVSRQLGPQFGRDVHFVSLTSDPKNDTPAALKAFAAKQAADVPGWTFVTGKKDNIDHILKKLGQFSENVEEHSTLFIAGNVPAKRWSKIRPDAHPAAIAERLRVLVAGGAAPVERPREP